MTYAARVLSVALALLLAIEVASAQQPPKTPPVVIRVSDMHCANCAKKIARKLYAVPGVVQVKSDVKKHTAWVTPEKNRQPDPLALWEAVEKAGFEPVLLAGPFGKFESKKDLEKRLAARP